MNQNTLLLNLKLWSRFEISLLDAASASLVVIDRSTASHLLTDISNAVQWLPGSLSVLSIGLNVLGRVTETGGCESALGPAVADTGEVPVNVVWRGEFVEGVASVNKCLNGRDVDVVNG